MVQYARSKRGLNLVRESVIWGHRSMHRTILRRRLSRIEVVLLSALVIIGIGYVLGLEIHPEVPLWKGLVVGGFAAAAAFALQRNSH
jgi:uncharacterized membrane protein YagU involved in acid resistance